MDRFASVGHDSVVNLTRIMLGLSLAGTAAAAMLTLAGPAQADGPITATSSCELTDTSPTWDNFHCNASWSGGAGTVTASFAPGNQHTGYQVTDLESGYAEVDGDCQTGYSASVILTLTDSVGATLTKNLSVMCHH